MTFVKGFRNRVLRNPIFALLGGFAIAGLGAGFVLLVLYWTAPLTAPELQGTVAYKSASFVLHYDKNSPERKDHEQLSRILERELAELGDLLRVDRDLIPTPIDVFVHDDVSALQASVIQRKGGRTASVYLAPLDLLVGEEPRTRLAELVLAFGWGRCDSQILQSGMRLCVAGPERSFHSVIAALPERLLLPLSTLIALDAKERIPKSLYQVFDSPYSPAGIASLGGTKEVLDLATQSDRSPENVPTLEAASFIQFLIETKGGIEAVKQAWGRGRIEELLKRITSDAVTQLEVAWLQEARKKGKDAPDYPYWHAYYLLESGDPDTAYAETRKWFSEALSDEERLLVGQCALTVGVFSDVSVLVESRPSGATAELSELLTLYEGWTVKEAEGLRLLCPAGGLESDEAFLRGIDQAYSTIITRLELVANQLPSKITVFVYADEPSRDRGAFLLPFPAEQSAIFHVVRTENLARLLGEVLPSYAWGKRTYSRLLRTGLAIALLETHEHLTAEGCRLWREGRWIPLSRLSFGAADQETVEIEAGLLVDHLLTTFGVPALRMIWVVTSPFDRYLSLDTAIGEICGTTRSAIEDSLFGILLHCY